jgi:Trypsin-like peptidase domain
MTVGRILGNNKDMGSGFALAVSHSGFTRVVLTANHVVDKQEISSIQFATQSGRRIPVERVLPAGDLDIAVLYLGEDLPGGLAKGNAVEEAGWKVETQPRGNDPMLKGTIDATHWRVETKSGHEMYVLQLKVNYDLGDYKGYSGSAVMLDSPSGGVIGILIEQLLSRLSGTIGQSRAATNVLYAIPIQAVLDRFDLHDVPTASRRMKFDARKTEERLNKLQARANALNSALEDITEQRDSGIIDVGRFILLKKNLNQQRSEVLQEAARILEGLDEDLDTILLDAASSMQESGLQESMLMERLAQVARQRGLARQFVASLEKQQGTLLFWLMEVGKQLAKLAM